MKDVTHRNRRVMDIMPGLVDVDPRPIDLKKAKQAYPKV